MTHHLNDIAEKGYIRKEENVGLENKWYPTKRIEEFRSLWNDAGDLFHFDDAIEDKIGLLSTKQGQQFVQGDIVPAFLSLSQTPVFKTHKLFVGYVHQNFRSMIEKNYKKSVHGPADPVQHLFPIFSPRIARYF